MLEDRHQHHVEHADKDGGDHDDLHRDQHQVNHVCYVGERRQLVPGVQLEGGLALLVLDLPERCRERRCDAFSLLKSGILTTIS